MTDEPVRDVWVKSRTRHTPAHHITDPPDDDTPRSMYAVDCPPFLLTDGIAVTRQEAAALPAFPCTRCFPPSRGNR